METATWVTAVATVVYAIGAICALFKVSKQINEQAKQTGLLAKQIYQQTSQSEAMQSQVNEQVKQNESLLHQIELLSQQNETLVQQVKVQEKGNWVQLFIEYTRRYSGIWNDIPIIITGEFIGTEHQVDTAYVDWSEDTNRKIYEKLFFKYSGQIGGQEIHSLRSFSINSQDAIARQLGLPNRDHPTMKQNINFSGHFPTCNIHELFKKLEAYFNLCSEEYYFALREELENEVWVTWLDGMIKDFSLATVKGYWNSVKLKYIYYGDFVKLIDKVLSLDIPDDADRIGEIWGEWVIHKGEWETSKTIFI